jgi:spermidine/putrescine transport system permease protein
MSGAGRRRPDAERAVLWAQRVAPMAALGWLAVFFLAPLAIMVVYSFGHATFGGERLGFTLTNFRQALSGFYLHTFLHTLWFATAGTTMALVVALPTAYAIGRKFGRFKTALLVLLLVPFWTSFLIRVLSWQTLLAPGGVVEAVLNFVHLHHGTLLWLNTDRAVFIGIVYGYLPLMAIPLFVAFERIPQSALDASRDLGAGPLRTFVNVTLPLARPGIATGFLLTFIPMTCEYVTPALLGGTHHILMGGLISSEYLGAANFPLGSAMAVLMLLVIALAVTGLTRALHSFEELPS